MIAGISKPQWLLITTSETIVILINAIGMREEYLLYESRRLAVPKLFDCGNPWLKIIPETLIAASLLLMIAWLTVYISRQLFIQKLPLKLKIGTQGITAIFVGIFFMIVSTSFSDIWVYDFVCRVYGLAKSGFVHYWSIRIVFPATSILIFWAMYLSNQETDRELSTS